MKAVFVAVGQVPDSSAFSGLIMTDASGFVLAGEDCKTNVPGIFAVGDLRQKFANQIVVAAADGCIAALAAAHYVEVQKAGSSRPDIA